MVKSDLGDITTELQTLRERYSEMMKNVGKFVLIKIKGTSIVGYFDSYRAAINTGYKTFGLQNFLVRKVQRKNPIRIALFGLTRNQNWFC